MTPSLGSTACHVALYSYWEAKRDGRRMPVRRDLDPVEIKALLPQLMLLDIVPDGFRYRLVGTKVVQEMGRDLTGATVGSYVHRSNFGNTILAMFARVRDSRIPLFTTGEYSVPRGSTHWVSRLILPLGPREGAPDMLLLSRMARRGEGPANGAGWLRAADGRADQSAEVPNFPTLVALCRAWENGEALPSAA